MKTLKVNQSIRPLITFIIFLSIVDLSVIFNIHVLRQIGGFLLFTTVPGLLILGILNVERLGMAERMVIALGLSISFIVIFGLLINQLYPALGYSTPLSTPSITISYSVVLLALSIIAHFKGRFVASFPAMSSFMLTNSEQKYILLPAFLPMFSIIGIQVMNGTGNNAIIMIVLLIAPAYIIFVAIWHSRIPNRIYPAIITLLSISLLLMTMLRSQHVLGSDIHYEYYLFQLTASAQHWQIFANLTLDVCLAINLLPAIYYSFLNIPPESLFNLLTYTPLALSPLCVFIISRKYLGPLPAFLSAFFFMSQLRFQAFGGGRNDVAVFYFALSIMILFLESLPEFQRKVLFLIFAVSCVVSHYSATYIFLFVMVFAWLGLRSADAIRIFRNRSKHQPPRHFSQTITIFMLMILTVTIYIWYSEVSRVAFTSGVSIIYTTLINMGNLFLVELHSDAIQAAAGVGLAEKGLPQHIEFVFSWLTIIFISLGLLGTITKYRIMVAGNHKDGNSVVLQRRIDQEFFAVALACYVILALATILPRLTIAYDMGRIFFQMTAVLAPFFMIGSILTARMFKAHSKVLITIALMVLIPYFMCTSGTMYQFFSIPKKPILNSAGASYTRFYVHNQDSYAAKWLAQHSGQEMIYARDIGIEVLVSQAGLPVYTPKRRLVAFNKDAPESIKGYIFLRYIDTLKGGILQMYPELFEQRDVLYVNGKSIVYK